MAVTLTTDEKAELEKFAPRIRREAHIIKDYYGTPTEIEITDYVNRYGVFRNDSTLVAKNWTMPHLTMIAQNTDNYFNEYVSDSIWNTSPAADPEECLLRIRVYVVTDSGETMLIEYLGRVLNVALTDTDIETYAELETVIAPGYHLKKMCTRRDGSYTDFDWSAGTMTKTNKGGTVIPAPHLTAMPAVSPTHSYFINEWNVNMYDISNLFELACRVHTAVAPYPVGWECQPQTYYNAEEISRLGASRQVSVHWNDVGSIMNGPGTYADLHFYNPVQFEDQAPSRCALDLLRYGAGLSTGTKSHIDESSFSAQDSYFTSQSPSFVLRAAVYDKTFAEGLIDILSYMPEMFVWWSYDSKLTLQKHWPVLNAPSYKFVESLKNYSSIETEYYTERSCNDLEVKAYSAYVTNKDGYQGTAGWHAERELTQHKDGKSKYPLKIRRKPTDFSLPASTVDKLISVERPWISEDSGTTAQAHTVNLNWLENYLTVWSPRIKRAIVRSDMRSLEIECGDKVGVDVLNRGYDNEVFVCAAKDVDLDTLETKFVLADLTF